MLKAFRDLLTELTGVAPHDRFEDNDYRLAAAALLVHASEVDGGVSHIERQKLHALLKEHFKLSDADTAELIREAVEADRQAVDLYHFTSLLNRALDEEGRCRIIEMMWEIVYADGKVNEFEDNLVWRAADLLNVSANERIALRRRVAATQPNADDQSELASDT